MSSFHFSSANGRPDLTALEVEQLVQDNRLLRILRPNLQKAIERAAAAHREASHYLVRCEGQLYLSFDSISDAAQRRYIYHLVHQYQLGENVDLRPLPPPLRQLLQPGLTRTGRLLGSLLISAFVGLIIGVLAMAVGLLALTGTGLLANVATMRLAGLEMTAVLFVVFGALGWAGGTIVTWHKLAGAGA
jgi:hypothetical protein